jgi:hypothetical protein
MLVRKIYWFGGYGVGGRVFMEIEFDIPSANTYPEPGKGIEIDIPTLTQSTITLVNTLIFR